MSKFIAIGIVIVSATLFLSAAVGGDPAPAKFEGPKIVAYATATSLVKPDSARLTFALTASVEGEDRSAHAANELQIKSMKEALQKQTNAKFDVETTPAAASTLVSSKTAPGTAPSIVAKKSQTVFRVTINDADFDKLKEAVGRLSDAIVSHGGTSTAKDDSSPYRYSRRGEEEPDSVHGPSIEWLAADTSTAKRDAIRRAMKEARADAEAAAGTDKLKIMETTVWGGDYSPQQASGVPYYYGNQSPSSAATGMVQVKVFVNITCTY